VLKLPDWRRKLKNVFILSLAILPVFVFIIKPRAIHVIKAETLEELEQQKEEAEKDLEKKQSELSSIQEKADAISKTIGDLSGKLSVTKTQINDLETQIKSLTDDIQNLSQKMDIKQSELNQREKIRDLTLRNLYINDTQNILELLLAGNNVVSLTQSAFYFQSFVDNSENLIISINNDIKQFAKDKKTIEEIKDQVEKQKKDMATLAAKIASEVNSAQGELTEVSQKKVAVQQDLNEINKKLSEISAKQRALLAEKTETFSTSVGDVPTSGDPNSRADYDPGFTKAFAAFSFGAPHRKGMSQYGAKGRAESGQDYKDILKAYYGDIEITEPGNLPITIRTSSGTFDLDGKYLKGIAEMPSDWPMEALKAQAIAARTYALSYIGYRRDSGGGSGQICTTENCQVWSSSKASSSSATRWHQAVEETKGKIMIGKATGEIFSAWYAASSGGYNYSYTSLGHSTSGGWDTKCKSRDCWTSDAYESIGSSPWFYKGWYKSRSNKSCGRSHPWLTEEEFADIIGALALYEDDKDNQKHLSQPDAQSCYGENIPDTWSKDTVREKSGISEIKSVDVSYSSGGYTAEVKVNTNKGEYKFSGEDFKAIFNLRAPGVIHLKSMLFNIEVKD